MYTDKEIVRGILDNDSRVINYVYKMIYPSIKNYILSNSGSPEDVEDVFQEAFVTIYKSLKRRGYIKVDSFKSYMFVVCKNTWLDSLRRSEASVTETVNNWDSFEEEYEANEKTPYDDEKYQLFLKHFNRLSSEQRRALNYFFDSVPLKVIAVKMGYSSEDYAKSRKYRFKKKLIERIKSDPLYWELIKSEKREEKEFKNI